MARWAPYFLVPFLVLALAGTSGVAQLTHHPVSGTSSAAQRYGPIALKRYQEIQRIFDRRLDGCSGVPGFVPSPACSDSYRLATLPVPPVCRALDPLDSWKSLQL